MSKGWKITLLIVGMIACTVGVNRLVSSSLMMELLKKRLKTRNPTSYVFDFSREAMKQAVRRRIGGGEYRGMYLSGFGEMGRGMTGAGFENTDYFTLYAGTNTLESFSYRTRGRGRFTDLDLEIHLDSLGPRKTRVRMETKKHEVISGYGFTEGIHSFFGALFQSLPPTTIEQYQVLYKIGKELGVSDDMPRVNYPKALDREELLKTYYNAACRSNNEYKYYVKGYAIWDEFDE